MAQQTSTAYYALLIVSSGVGRSIVTRMFPALCSPICPYSFLPKQTSSPFVVIIMMKLNPHDTF